MGVVDVEAMRESVEPSVITRWIAYDSIESLDPTSTERSIAIMAATLANLLTSKSSPHKPENFAPWLEWPDDEDDEQDAEVGIDQINRIVSAMGG